VGALQDDAWSMYPDEDVEEDEDQHDPGKSEVDTSLVRREQALNRLSQVRERRISLYTDPSHLPSGHTRQGSLVHPPGDTSLASTPTQCDAKDDEDGNEEDDGHEEDGSSSPIPRSSLLRFQRKTREQETDNMSLATKLHNTSLQTMVQVWMSFQFVAVLVVFLYFTVKKGPTAIMVGGAGSAGPAKVRSSRGSRGAISHRR